MSTLTHADEARLAHRALRLLENGVDSESKLREISGLATPDSRRMVRMSGGHPLANIAFGVEQVLESDLPGPTDKKAVERVMGMSLTDVYKVWESAVEANLETILPDAELKRWRKSVERDQREFEKRVAMMQETGDFPVHPYFGHNRHLDGAANALYDSGREGILNDTIAMSVAVFKVALVDSAVYTVNLATHINMSSVASVVATSAALGSKTYTAGVFDAADSTFTAATGAQSEALIIYQASAVTGGADVAAASQRLLAYIDTATGLPVTPNGGDITVVWDSGTNRIFKL